MGAMQADASPTGIPAHRTLSHLEAVTEATRVLTEVLFDLQPVLDTVVRRLATSVGDLCVMQLLSADGLSPRSGGSPCQQTVRASRPRRPRGRAHSGRAR